MLGLLLSGITSPDMMLSLLELVPCITWMDLTRSGMQIWYAQCICIQGSVLRQSSDHRNTDAVPHMHSDGTVMANCFSISCRYYKHTSVSFFLDTRFPIAWSSRHVHCRPKLSKQLQSTLHAWLYNGVSRQLQTQALLADLHLLWDCCHTRHRK